MKHILTFWFCLLLIPFSAFSQSRLGDVAVVYLTSPERDSSVQFYNKLGFATQVSVDNPRRWALLSDGSVDMMIRQDTVSLMGLCYYSKDPGVIAAQLETEGFVFSKKPKPEDLVKRYFLQSPEGFTILFTNNAGHFEKPEGITLLNMPPSDFTRPDKYPNTSCGVFGEYAIPVKDLETSKAFWQKLGFTVKADMKAPYPHAILYDGLMIIGLHQTVHFNYPAVTYFGTGSDARMKKLEQVGVNRFKTFMSPGNYVLQTPEAQHFFLFSL